MRKNKFNPKRVGRQIVIPTKNFISGFATPHFSSKTGELKCIGLHIVVPNTPQGSHWQDDMVKTEKDNGVYNIYGKF